MLSSDMMEGSANYDGDLQEREGAEQDQPGRSEEVCRRQGIDLDSKLDECKDATIISRLLPYSVS